MKVSWDLSFTFYHTFILLVNTEFLPFLSESSKVIIDNIPRGFIFHVLLNVRISTICVSIMKRSKNTKGVLIFRSLVEEREESLYEVGVGIRKSRKTTDHLSLWDLMDVGTSN